MEPQACLSLAIQALHERYDNIQRRTPDNEKALQDCREAVAYLEGIKVMNQWVNGFKECKVELHLITPCSDEDNGEKE
jgi:hypothetical protein